MDDRPSTDGNLLQLEMIADKLGEAIVSRLDEADKGRAFHTDHAFIEWLDKRIVDKLKLWAATLLLAYCIPIGIAVWQLSALNAKVSAAFQDTSDNRQSLQARSGWITDQERFNCDVRRAVNDIRKDSLEGPCNFTSGADRTDPRR